MAVNGQKLLPQGNRGGALAVSRPKVSLVKKEVKKDIISAPNAPDNMLVIKTRVVEIEKILKGSVALDKKLQDEERKKREKESRAEEEKELETKDDDDADKKVKKKKSKIKLGFLDGLIKFINDVLMGWLLVRMVDFLPQLKKILPLLGGALDFLTSTVLGIVNVLGTFLMWGDKAISGSRKFVENIFGEKGAKVFDAIVGTIGNLFNLIAILGMTAGAFGNEWGRQSDKPGGKPGKKPKWQKKLQQKWKKSRLGKSVRNFKAGWKRTTRKISKALKPKNIIKNIKKLKPLKTLQNVTKNIKNIKPLKTLQNVTKNIKPLKTLQNVTKNIKNIKPLKTLQNVTKNIKPLKTLQNLNPFKGMNLGKKAGNLWKGAKQLGGKALSGVDNWAKNQMGKLGTMWKGAKSFGAKIGGQIKNIAKMAMDAPGKLKDLVKSKIGNKIDDIVKKNKTLKNLLSMAKNPKKISGAIKGMLNTAKKSKGILNVRAALSKAKAAKVGGVDKIITAVMALIDYMVLKESPINAIVKAVSGMLGYAAGFAIGAPFGGMPGFITGMAGGALGELAGYGLLKGLAKGFPGLTQVDDPIMNDGRPILRDPDGPMDHMMNQSKEKESDTKTKTTTTTTTTTTISRSNQPNLNTLLRSDKRADIEQALYTMRIDAAKGSGKGISDWVGNKKHAKDADLIMEHGLHNVIIDGGKVTLKESYKASLMPIDVNSVAKNTDAISKHASYEEGGEGGTVVIVENSSGGGDQQTESGSTVVAGGGSDDSTTDALYKGG